MCHEPGDVYLTLYYTSIKSHSVHQFVRHQLMLFIPYWALLQEPLALPVSCIILALSSSSHPYKDQSYKVCIETALFWAEAKFASLFLKTAQVTQQTGRKTAQKLVYQRILRRRKTSQKFLRGECVPRADQTLQPGQTCHAGKHVWYTKYP